MADAFDELAGLYFKAGSKAGGVYKKVRERLGGWSFPPFHPGDDFCLFFSIAEASVLRAITYRSFW